MKRKKIITMKEKGFKRRKKKLCEIKIKSDENSEFLQFFLDWITKIYFR